MAKFLKKSKFIEITDLRSNELNAILKLNVQCRIVSLNNGEVIDYIDLYERSFTEKSNYINIIDKIENKTKAINYGELHKLIAELSDIGIISIRINKSVFTEKEPLFLMIDTLKQEIINSCVYLDYNHNKRMFTLLNRPKNNLPDKLFYFEDNDSILVFSPKTGPNLIYGKTSSIEDLICQ